MRSITRIQDRTVRILEENPPIVPDDFACSGEVRYLLNHIIESIIFSLPSSEYISRGNFLRMTGHFHGTV